MHKHFSGIRLGFVVGTYKARTFHSQVANTTGLNFKLPKTKKSRRLVTLPESIVHELQAHQKRQEADKHRLDDEYQDNDLIFCLEDGRPWHPGTFSNDFHDLLIRHDLPHIRFHDLRHTHASLLLRQGVHPKVVSERLGHSQIGITMDLYSHVLPGIQKEVARQLDDLFNKFNEPNKPNKTKNTKRSRGKASPWRM